MLHGLANQTAPRPTCHLPLFPLNFTRFISFYNDFNVGKLFALIAALFGILLQFLELLQAINCEGVGASGGLGNNLTLR